MLCLHARHALGGMRNRAVEQCRNDRSDGGVLRVQRHRLQIHANEHSVEVHASIESYGKRPIEYLYDLGALGSTTLLAHATLVTPGEIAMLVETDTAVSYNPVAAMWKGNAIAPALDYIRRGLRVGLGSDATRNDAFRMIDAAESAQRIAFGIPADDFSCGAGWTWFEAATQGGAMSRDSVQRPAPSLPAAKPTT